MTFGALVGHEREGQRPQTRMNKGGAYRDRTGDLRLAKEAQGRSRRYWA